MDPDPLSNFKIRPRLARNPRSYRQLNSLNFPVLDGNWGSAASNHLQPPRRNHSRTPPRIVEPAKNVPWKKGLLDFLLSVDRKSTRLNSSHIPLSRMPSSA